MFFNKILISVFLTQFPQLINCGTSYDKKYHVIIHNKGLVDSLESVNSTCYTMNAEHINYQCWIPYAEEEIRPENSHDKSSAELEMEKKKAIEAIEQFNFINRGNYATKSTGYWDYTVKFDHNIQQRHMDKDYKNGILHLNFYNYNLGSWTDAHEDGSDNSKPYYEIESHKNPYASHSDFEIMSLEDGTKYVTQRIGNGDICDLTGLPRSTTIKYLCNNDITEPQLRKVYEWRTCEYMLELESNWFCNFDMWTLPKALVVNDVNCYPEEDIATNLEFRELIDLRNYKLESLANGIFIGRIKEEIEKFVLILTKNYNFWDDDNDNSSEKYQKFLMDFSLGFQKYIKRQKLINNESSTNFVKVNDIFQIIVKLYDVDRAYIGNVQIDQDQDGFLVSFFTDQAVPENSNFWTYYESGISNTNTNN